jgi:hypothetical protein
VLNTLRMIDKVGSLVDANTRVKRLKAAQPTEKELAMAARVVESLTQEWDITRCPDGLGDDQMEQLGPGPAGIWRPRTRLPKGRAGRDRVAKDEITKEEIASDGAARRNRAIVLAQRASRPRSRVRRTYH